MEGYFLANAIIALSLKVANICIHSVGIYILRCLQLYGRGDVQTIYTLNLSVTELIINVLSFVRNLLKLTPYAIFKTDCFKFIVMYSYIVDYTVLKLSLYLTMIVLTLDRLLLVVLGVFYPLYWNTRKAKMTVIFIWIVAVTLCVCTSIQYDRAMTYVHQNSTNENLGKYKSSKRVNNYFFLMANFVTVCIDFMFLTMAIISYGMIFHRLKQSQQGRYPYWGDKNNKTYSLWYIFRKSRFYSALFLILTFVAFVIPADLVWAFYSMKNSNKAVELLTTASYALSYLADGIIYIFMNNNVKMLLQRKARNRKRESITTLNYWFH